MEELAAYICTALDVAGIDTVLSGGCCVELYSRSRYTSDDIDLIDRFNGGHRKIKEVMEKLGFREYKMKRYFVHDETSLFLEFPRGPLGVGDAPVEKVSIRETETGVNFTPSFHLFHSQPSTFPTLKQASEIVA